MKRRSFIRRTGHVAVAAVAGSALAGCRRAASDSLQAGEILTTLPGVRNFRALRQYSPKNDYTYSFLTKFDSQAEFDAYTAHPDLCRFVTERWETEVTLFQESDFITP